MMEPPPTWQPIRLQCKKCGHNWDAWQPHHVPLSTWVAHVKTYRCPTCGAGRSNVLVRAAPLTEPPP